MRNISIRIASILLMASAGLAHAQSSAGQATPGDTLGEVQRMISSYRLQHGLSRVAPDASVQRAAQFQADAMARADAMSHEVAGAFGARLNAAGVARGSAVENIAAGFKTFAATFAGWQGSPGHNANLLDPAMRRFGIARAYATGGKFKVFWALVMAD